MKERSPKTLLPPIIQSLVKPGALPGNHTPAEVIQTQMSWVLLAGNFVYKIKKPVNLGYVDYTSLEKRRYFCQREIELNRRLCSEYYLGVVTVNLEGADYSIDGRGEIVDYAVKMKRLPAEKMLDYLLEHDDPPVEMLEMVAEKIASFHKQAETGPLIDPFGSIDTIRFNAEENFSQSKKYAGTVVHHDTLARIEAFTLSFLESNEKLFSERVQNSHIRDCHGDLHSAHICFTDKLCIYDCIEFNDRFRYSDTASETAFLAMDLDHYGRADLAHAFISHYLKITADAQTETLIRFYKCYRAMIRAKVNCFKLDDPYINNRERELSADTARLYFDLAESYTMTKPALLVNVGLVGSGKSTFSKKLAGHMGMIVISSDIVRKKLAGIPATKPVSQAIDTGIYSRDFSRLTYETMLKQAAHWLKKGVSVILDATFVLASSRRAARDVALAHNANFAFVEYPISDEEACRRIIKRQADPANVSDGTTEVYFKMKQEFEPLDEREAKERVIIDYAGQTAENIAKVRHFIFNS
jgi:aminoglycoside phosphotransferase family enzyme/predicted kinase